jgi:hypothetical protein
MLTVPFKRASCLLIATFTALLPISVAPMGVSAFGSPPGSGEACGVNLSPSIVEPLSENAYDVTISNTGNTNLSWLQVTRPSANFTVNGDSEVGWTDSTDASSLTLTNGTIGIGNSFSFQVAAFSGETTAPAEAWHVTASANVDGSSPINCSGSAETAIAGHPPNTNDTGVSNVTATDITTTSAAITWNSDNPASSVVYYGTDSGYGNNSNVDNTQDTDHSLTISGLSSGTLYHYQVAGLDNNGNVASSGDNTFTTGGPSAGSHNPTGASSNSGTGSSSTTGKKREAAKKGDGQPPKISLITVLAASYKTAPAIAGTATDNAAVASVDYSTDGGKNWLPADTLSGAGTAKVQFSFTPLLTSDGNYLIKARAIDNSGEVGTTPSQTLVIDLLPPIVGASVSTVGSQLLKTNTDGSVAVVQGVDQKITLDAIGGPSSITIEATAAGGQAPKAFTLKYSTETQLWSGNLTFSQPGTYTLRVNAVDGAKNTTSRELNKVVVQKTGVVKDSKSGKPLSAELIIKYLDSETATWVVWDGSSYDQLNPIKTGVTGHYSLFLPAGKYYLKTKAEGYRSNTSRIFELKEPTAITGDISLSKKPGFALGPLKFHMPVPTWATSAIRTSAQTASPAPATQKSLPGFSLPLASGGKLLSSTDLLGKPTILSYITTWSSASQDQLPILNSMLDPHINVYAIGSGESIAKLAVYSAIAHSDVPIVADTDNQLLQQMDVSSLPTHFFIDRHGIIQKIVTGVLSKKELINNVVN